MAKLVSKTYGDALFAVAVEEDRLDEFWEAAKSVSDVLDSKQDFWQFIFHPQIAKEDKIKVIEESFTGKIPAELIGLMTLMVSKGRAEELQSVLSYFIDLVKEEKKIGKAYVTTAVELNEKHRKEIEEKLLSTTSYESFEMDYQVDESLIGGMVIRIGDRVVDSSIKAKLQNLTRELRKIQV